jgi:hypothetical protein
MRPTPRATVWLGNYAIIRLNLSDSSVSAVKYDKIKPYRFRFLPCADYRFGETS